MKAKMRNPFRLITKYPVTGSIAVLIWVLCLVPIPDNPLGQVRLIDKWTHFVMYGGLCSVMWVEYARRHASIEWKHAFWWLFAAPLLMGGLVEIVQATCTGGRRSGDWLDFAADGIGVLLGQLIGILLARYLSTRKKGKSAGLNCKSDGRR